jgi:hypothetical protein
MMLDRTRPIALATMNLKTQWFIICWAVGALLWYIHRFSAVLSPFLHDVFHEIWH